MTRLFDPVSLMQQDLGEGSTRRTLLPQGEVIAQIGRLSFKDGEIKNGERAGETWNRVDVPLEITDPDYLSQYADGQSKKAYLTYGIMLDMENGVIKMGPNKNLKLNRLREAAGVNGKPLAALEGQFVRIQIGWSQIPNSEDMKDDVVAVSKV